LTSLCVAGVSFHPQLSWSVLFESGEIAGCFLVFFALSTPTETQLSDADHCACAEQFPPRNYFERERKGENLPAGGSEVQEAHTSGTFITSRISGVAAIDVTNVCGRDVCTRVQMFRLKKFGKRSAREESYKLEE